MYVVMKTVYALLYKFLLKSKISFQKFHFKKCFQNSDGNALAKYIIIYYINCFVYYYYKHDLEDLSRLILAV